MIAALVAVIMSVAVVSASAEPDDELVRCAAGGGCLKMTRAQILKAMENAFEIGREKGESQGYDKGQKTCWKPT